MRRLCSGELRLLKKSESPNEDVSKVEVTKVLIYSILTFFPFRRKSRSDWGLLSVLLYFECFSGKISSTKTVNISFNSNMFDIRLNYNTEVILYRVVCELINNTLKHANAKNIEIELTRHNRLVTLVYSDDGKGFEVNEVLYGKSEGMGYSNIMSRIKSIKGIMCCI